MQSFEWRKLHGTDHFPWRHSCEKRRCWLISRKWIDDCNWPEGTTSNAKDVAEACRSPVKVAILFLRHPLGQLVADEGHVARPCRMVTFQRQVSDRPLSLVLQLDVKGHCKAGLRFTGTQQGHLLRVIWVKSYVTYVICSFLILSRDANFSWYTLW